MFSSSPNYPKLKTNLRLSINRLKLLEKKKTELAQKARKEIADYLSTGKVERAKIRVEHIIREDYLVEAMEVTEMYCDLLLARYGLIQQMKDLDEGLAEAISSIIWVSPRLQTDVQEIKIIADQLSLKYGKPYAQACREQQVNTISEKLIHKLSVQAPPKLLVQKYLIEIAKNYNIDYEPDPQLMREAEWNETPLITMEDSRNNLGGNGGSNPGPGSDVGGSSHGGGGMNIPLGFEPQTPNASGFNYPPQMIDHARTFPMQYPMLPPNLHSHLQQLPENFVPSIFLTNPQSLANSFEEFSCAVQKHDPDVAAIAETWFSEKHPADDFKLQNYVLFNEDRDTKRGGGVAIYVKSTLSPYEPIIKVPLDLECLWVGIGRSLFICTLYNPPKSPMTKLLLAHLSNAILDLRQRVPCARVIIIGDFNQFPHEKLYSSLCLVNLVQEPTHMNSSIDLILTDASKLFNPARILPPIGKSLHHCVFVTAVHGQNDKEYNLPNVPTSGYNPPPPDMSADSLANNNQTGTSNWDEILGIENSPPPPYTSADHNPHTRPTAPYPSLPGAGPLPPKMPLPPDMQSDSAIVGNFKESNLPKPSPRSKFENQPEFNMPDLPNVPDVSSESVNNAVSNTKDTSDDIDFDDLNRRFEQLKKKK